ncbi:MAG TPA: hypothetical protein VMW01_07480 [Williamwhitmania sp.]|nr:hypothetical protein [Williamwhitmania sp.]
MLQDILALTTVFAAATYAAYGLYKTVNIKPSQNGGGCCGCSAGAACSAKGLKKVVRG